MTSEYMNLESNSELASEELRTSQRSMNDKLHRQHGDYGRMKTSFFNIRVKYEYVASDGRSRLFRGRIRVVFKVPVFRINQSAVKLTFCAFFGRFLRFSWSFLHVLR